MSTFSVEIVTPIKVLNQENVSYIRCPGLDGSFGVMKKHREGVIALDVGEIKIKTDGNTEWYATSGGFAEIGSTKIDVKRAARALERAKDRKNNPQEKIDTIRLEASLTRAMNRLRVSKK